MMRDFLKTLVKKPGFLVVLFALSAADLFLVVFPIEGLALASVLTHRRTWLRTALSMAAGSTLGCIVLAQLTYSNADWVLSSLEGIKGGLTQSSSWQWVQSHVELWGAPTVIVGAFTPIPLQVLAIAPALAGLTPWVLFLALAIGRLSRSLLLCWVGSHASGSVLRALAHYQQAKEELKKLQKN
jgi:membrane protein YqaA with SNARE-associated domain